MIQKEARESSASYKRQQLADYALQFVGGPYQYGGSDPHTGVDCSGFTRYVYQHGAGITLTVLPEDRLFRERISADQMRPGDLLFYGRQKQH